MNFPKTLSYDDYMSLTSSMFESNNLVELTVKWGLKINSSNYISSRLSLRQQSEITITSIEVRFPVFNIWDTVMIVDTGEIVKIIWYDPYNMRREFDYSDLCIMSSWLVKIPSDLLYKLQD